MFIDSPLIILLDPSGIESLTPFTLIHQLEVLLSRKTFREEKACVYLFLFTEKPSQAGLDAFLLLHTGNVAIACRRLQHVHGRHATQMPKRLLTTVA